VIETIKAFFAASPVLAWNIVSVMAAMVVMVSLWDKLKWWWLNFWASFPLIGRIATLSKDLNRANGLWSNWFNSEKVLCRNYKKFVRIQDEHDFYEKIEYLSKARDNGRKPTPGWLKLLTVSMVFVEAMGFSYVLAGYTLPGASENLQQTGAYGIAFLISIILVALTHYSGSELHKSIKIKHARSEWNDSKDKTIFESCDVPISKPQSTDDGQPGYKQLINRVGAHQSYIITSLTVVFVIVVAVFATYVRGQVLEKTLHEEVVAKSAQMNIANPVNSDGLNMEEEKTGNPALPDADIAQNQAAIDKAVKDETSIDRHGGWGTFIVLAFVFVFLQILGVIFGFRWGFAGRNSEAAYKAIGGGRYTTYADVREHYKEIADTAQAKLEILQQKLMVRNCRVGTEGMNTNNTFYDFMELDRQEESPDNYNKRQHTEQKVALPQVAVAPIIQTAKIFDSVVPPTFEEAIRKVNTLTDKAAKFEYIFNLPQPLKDNVSNEMKRIKAAEVSRAQFEAEMDGCL